MQQQPETPFQDWLNQQLRDHKWTYAQAGARMGNLVPQDIQNYVNGVLPGIEKLKLMAEATGTPLEQLQAIYLRSQELKAAFRLARRAERLEFRRARGSRRPARRA